MSQPPSDEYRILKAASKGDLEKLREIAAAMGNSDAFRGKCEILYGAGEWAALHKAAELGRINICKFLIKEVKVDIDIKSGDGRTSLLLAVQRNHVHTAKYLIKHSANIAMSNTMGETSLHHAAINDNKELMQLLLLKGADIERNSAFGPPLTYATSAGNVESVKFLLARGVKPNAVSPLSDSPLVSAISPDTFECFELLLKAGADPNLSSCGRSPLVHVILQGEVEFLGSLLEAGADPNQVDMFGMTPIEHAAGAGNEEMVQILFPMTQRIQAYPDWSIDGLMKHVSSVHDRIKMEKVRNSKFQEFKGRGDHAMTQGDFSEAVKWYTEAIYLNSWDASLRQSRSKCFSKLNEPSFALFDALACTRLQPDWAQGHFREGKTWYTVRRSVPLQGLAGEQKDEIIHKALKSRTVSNIILARKCSFGQC